VQWYHDAVGALRDAVRGVLERNRRVVGATRYTQPALSTYPHQWLWDSCFHAILWALLGDRAMAHDELRALFRAQVTDGLDRGRIPHMTFHDGATAGDVQLWGSSVGSTLTQPPVVAEAVLRVGDASLWRELWAPLCAYYDWWLGRRDVRGDGLVTCWHPWECGADATPRADGPMLALAASGRQPRALSAQTHNPTARKRADLLTARFLLLEDLHAIDEAERAGTVAESVAQHRRLAAFGHVAADMQAFLARNLLDLATIGEHVGEHAAAGRYRAQATRIGAALEQLWDDATGAYLDRLGPARERVAVVTPATLIPLYTDAVPEPHARQLLALADDPRRFATRWPLPSVSRDDPSYDADEYWRGSTWISHNWFVCRGLAVSARRFGEGRFRDRGRAIARSTVELVETVGLREYYRSDGDAPAAFGPEGFGWSGLALDLQRMLDEELA
jgi:glycogen debranching enzyme